MKKKLAFLLSICTVFCSAGCANKNQADNNGDVTLKWILLGPGIQDDSEKVWQKVNEKLKTYEGMENTSVDVEILDGADYQQKFVLLQTSGQQLDIVQTCSLDFYKEVKNKSFIALDDYLSKTDAYDNAFPDWFWDYGKVDGKLYQVPNYQLMMYGDYSLYTPKALGDKYGINGKETYRLPNYMIEMAKAYSEDANRMYQVQEFGMADQWFKTNEELENFIFGTLENCASDKNIWGVTWWCSHDIKQEFLGFVDFEHNLGLINTENKPKQAGIIFKKFIDNYKAENYIQPQPSKALVIQSGTGDECDFTNAQRYFDCYAKGENVAFVTEEMKNNTDYLVSRGIKEIIE